MTSDIDGTTYDTDKPPGYLAEYKREFGHLYSKPIKLLELGVQRGGSLLLFRDLFPSGTITGLDLNATCIEDSSGRVHVYQGFQQDATILDQLAAEQAPEGFDIIIDDASHLGRYTRDSFWHLFPRHLKRGGVYVLDDWGTGYWGDWPDGHDFRGRLRSDGALKRPSAPAPGNLEIGRRKTRARARQLSTKLEKYPAIEQQLRRAYMWTDGAAVKRRFRSHDHGMVGLVKQLVDECAVETITRKAPTPLKPLITRVTVTPAQTFVWKAA